MIGQIGHENGPADICIKKDPDLDRSPQHLKKETSTETDITMCADETAHKLVILHFPESAHNGGIIGVPLPSLLKGVSVWHTLECLWNKRCYVSVSSG
ncbi:hypothetical protein J4Q44_G00361390 [Coregonus suidteri]|uniref:Uncharacterized protein n=1 Tax=Coregonus suidteri TaxID=861788 RepID=A0AAN8KLP0_9TELE